MKKDIVACISRCLNYQQVKYEHYKWEGLIQRFEILEFKWERITMDFVFLRAVQRELGTRVELGTIFHPQTDGQSECTIQILEYMLRACIMDFGGSWDHFLPLAEFAYNNNNFQSSIQITPYEALYERRFRSPVDWFEPGEARLLGTNLVCDALEKGKVILERLCTTQSMQKSYADKGS
ncbi:uncharacterized protein [Nicotiana tomentosiformis]|uniref:uncharacterized protein n=1 Tax=Nicotiana tomentosiformis TaxID=4098 RepID=UPI00388CDB7E